MSTLFLEAFGQLSPGTNLIDAEEEDLYSVFRARAELMGSSSTTIPRPRRPMFWDMNEAELTAGTDASRIGWVQVGLDVGDLEPTRVPPAPVAGWGYASLGVRRRPIEPAIPLPALAQCFDDALRRFGDIELSGIQVTAYDLDPDARSPAGDLVSALNWFNTTLKGKADALIAFNQELLGGQTEAELVVGLQRRNTGLFEFGPVVAVPEQHSIKASFEWPERSISPARSGLGVSVMLPEWTASAVGWALATVIDAARGGASDVRNFAVRVTRVR